MPETHLSQGRQTSKLGMIAVIGRLFPGYTLKIEYSILEGVFLHLIGSVLSEREVAQIDKGLREWMARDVDIVLLGRHDGFYHYMVEGTLVKTIYPALLDPSMIEPFQIIPFSDGFIVDFGDVGRGRETPLIPPRMLAATYDKSRRWLRNIGVEFVSDVNAYLEAGTGLKLLSIAEALHEKEISDIADLILQQRRTLRVLLISGPSSSGKTTFARRICTQLEVNGMTPVPLSLDEYYLDRDRTPLDAEGKLDFEVLGALDLELLQEHIARLAAGETVPTPVFDFAKGARSTVVRPVRVGPTDVLVIEGIHALNPDLLTGVNSSLTYRIFVSALGGVGVDHFNRVPTTEIRLIRRLVRDVKFRGTSPEATLDRWASVRRGEYANVFAYQEEADVMFNTSMLYELNALRPYAEACLRTIADDSAHADTRDRLLNLLAFFTPMDTSRVPFNSILREFIGDSIYS